MLDYLFELDSVCNSTEEIEIGQKALFNALVRQGDIVVLSYNQLTDSAAFWAALKDEKVKEAMMEMCRNGRIRINIYAGQRTASEYIVKHIEKSISVLKKRKANTAVRSEDEGQFYFSLIPIDPDEVEILEDLKRAILYSDLQLLREKALTYL